MAATLTDWLRNLRTQLPDTETDANLLRRFGTDRDEDAFSALVSRHGPMVFGVCRRVLGHGPDAEDAFQAVFVILAVKAADGTRIGKVGAWLHGVAFHTARKARTRRCTRTPAANDLLDLIPSRDEHHDPDADNLREKLDEVLAGLPDRYRAAVVLCELEQLSRAEAAGRLGWTEGTLSGRLARARKLLADRLTRRGVAFGGLLAALSARPLSASVPGTLAASAINVAKLVRGGLPLPAGLAALTHGVTRAMFLNRLKLTAAGLMAAGILTAGLGSLWATDPPPAKLPAPPQAAKVAPAAAPWTVKYEFKHDAGVTAVAFGADLIASGDADGNLTLWDAQTGKEKEKLIEVKNRTAPWKHAINSLAFNPDSTWVYLANFESSAMHGCRLDPKNRIFPGFGAKGLIKAFGIAPDAERLVYAHGNDVRVMQNRFPDNTYGVAGAGDPCFRHDAAVELCAVAPDNGTVMTVTTDDELHGWDFATQKELWSVKTGKLVPKALAISPDGKTLAVGGGFTLVRLFDTKTGKELATLEGHTKSVGAVAFSPDGKRLATGGDDSTIRFWDVATHKRITTLKAHAAGSGVDAIAFSPDGAMLVSGSHDKTVKVWHLGK